ncbi:MAG: hypothetical protein KF744_02950 [Taibaiella sp.]|nr:hypothetical protein [Taibaiella sp.]
MKNLLLSFLALSINAFSCTKKDKEPEATPCSATLYAYSAPTWSDTVFATTSCTFGLVDTTTGAVSTIATFNNGTSSRQGAFNTTDNCYYTIKSGPSTGQIHRVSLTGTVTTFDYPPSSGAVRYASIIYSEPANKLYVFAPGASTNRNMWEVGFSGSVSTMTPAASTEHNSQVMSSTVDNGSGNIYCLTTSASMAYVEKRLPGDTLFHAIDSIPIITWNGLVGLQYNTNDNMLYAVDANVVAGVSMPSKLYKINPTGGHTVIATLPFTVDRDHVSAVFDVCSNHYVLSAVSTAGVPTLSRFNVSGTLISHHTTTGLLLGLAIRY